MITTSEFNDVKSRMLAMHSRRKIDHGRIRTSRRCAERAGSTDGPIDADEDGKTPKADEDERPTLKKPAVELDARVCLRKPPGTPTPRVASDLFRRYNPSEAHPIRETCQN